MRHKREERRIRHERVWSVLRFMVTYNELLFESGNFYQYSNNKEAYEEARLQMKENHIIGTDIDTAIRFCQIENINGECDHLLTSAEIDQLYRWHEIQINEEELLNEVIDSYQAYWNEVLDSYKRPSARKNRLTYLINNLNEVMELHYIQKYPVIKERIKLLQSTYSDALSHL